jgi:hypothetical protein
MSWPLFHRVAMTYGLTGSPFGRLLRLGGQFDSPVLRAFRIALAGNTTPFQTKLCLSFTNFSPRYGHFCCQLFKFLLTESSFKAQPRTADSSTSAKSARARTRTLGFIRRRHVTIVVQSIHQQWRLRPAIGSSRPLRRSWRNTLAKHVCQRSFAMV